MPYLIYIGPNRANQSGTSAKGYWIFRRGVVVVARWGPVDVRGARGGAYRWRSYQEKRWTEASEADAADRIKRRIREAVSEGYRRLPSGRKIE
jgi:hypothetical protein